MSVSKCVVRWGVTAALVGGASALVAETVRPGSVHALLTQAGSTVAGVIDNNIDDPVALRAQLKALEAQYPEQIAEVRRDLAESEEQIAQLDRERAVADRVVALATEDLSRLEGGIAQAHGVQESHDGAIVRISFDNRSLALRDAYAKATQIEQTADIYAQRSEEIATELSYLADQRDQLAELLTKLETEQAEFQAQLFQLDAQIDAIARSDRMLAMMEDRQRTIDEHARYKAASLDQLQSRLAKVRAEQKGRLDVITSRKATVDYIDRARFEVDRAGTPVEIKVDEWTPSQAKVIEIDPDDGHLASSD
jgi:chromosome segregation ATPase